MKKDSIVYFLIRNKYVIILVALVLVLAFTGVIGKVMEILFTLMLIVGAIFLGKRIEEDEEWISHVFKKRKDNITYTVKDDDSNRE